MRPHRGMCRGSRDPSAKEQIRKLRQLLDPSVYLFVNAMQGLRKPLSEEDIRFFGEIDNLFDYDRRNAKACLDGCVGGRETLFIDRKGIVCLPEKWDTDGKLLR